MINVGERMKYIRRKYNLTQKQLAKQDGVSVSAISAYETGKYDPSCAVLIRFICIFDVSADFLLGLSGRDAIILHLDKNERNVLNKLVSILPVK